MLLLCGFNVCDLLRQPAKPDKIDEAAKKKKKKGEPDVELAHMPPEFSTLASFHIPLEDFTSGDYEFEKVFTLEELPSRPQSEMSESLKKKVRMGNSI